PISLATTLGISVDFFSCSYLDVSVRRVRFTHLCIQCVMTQRAGFPHSEIYGSKLVCQLPVAYRRLLRPSSPDIAKASTMCTYSLVPITLTSVARDVTELFELSVCRIAKVRLLIAKITAIILWLIPSKPTSTHQQRSRIIGMHQ